MHPFNTKGQRNTKGQTFSKQTPVERRAAILEEFDGSGMSGQAFAEHCGIIQRDRPLVNTHINDPIFKTQPYEVGQYNVLKANSNPYDALDIHHVMQQNPASQIITGYDYRTAPSIALPEGEHGLIPTIQGQTGLSPRDQLAKDIWDLRQNTNAPNSALQQLIQMNKDYYPILNVK